MQRLTAIGVFSLGKALGMSGVLIGLIIGIPYGLFAMLIGLGGGGASAGLGLGLGIMLLAPTLYGFVSFIAGVIYGLVLNVVLKMSGGIELTFERS